MCLKLSALLARFALDGGVGAGAGKSQDHGFVEEREGLDLADSVLGGLGRVKDNKCLALCFERFFGHNVDDAAVLAEDGLQRLLQRWDLD